METGGLGVGVVWPWRRLRGGLGDWLEKWKRASDGQDEQQAQEWELFRGHQLALVQALFSPFGPEE
jgi:hypothetical protein